MIFNRQKSKPAILGLAFSLALFMAVTQCREPKPVPPNSPSVPLAVDVLIKHSHGAPLHVCIGSDTAYSGCGSPHTAWTPAADNPLKRIEGTVYSRILLEQKLSDSSTVFIIENSDRSECHACSPTLSAAIVGSKRADIRFIPDLGEFGEYGKSPEGIRITHDTKGRIFLRTEFNSLHFGEIISGIKLTSLESPPQTTLIDLYGDNAGSCDSTANTCYGFKYEILNEGETLPDTLKLRGTGNRLTDEGKIDTVLDTIIAIR